jgi:hypothetical protein
MFKSITLLFVVLISLNAQADQQAILHQEEAEKTVAFLKKQNELILYCACCSRDTQTKMLLTKVSYECEASNWCKVRVEGTDVVTQETINKTIDLAYAWVNVEGVARNLAWEMGLNASPCTDPFDWETYELLPDQPKEVYDKEDAEYFETSFQELKKRLELDKGFTMETFESSKEFEVNKVELTKKIGTKSIIISQIGKDIEHRYTIPLDKLEDLAINEEGIEFDTMEDGVVMVEEFENDEVKVRMFYFVYTVPIPDVDDADLMHFGILWETHASMWK